MEKQRNLSSTLILNMYLQPVNFDADIISMAS